MRIARILFALALIAVSVVPSRAADATLPRMFGIFQMEPGSWSEYEIVDKKSGEITIMRMNVLAKEGDDFWYEVWMNQKEGKSTIRMLLSGDPNNPENVKRLILQSGEQRPVEMPRDFVVMGRRMAGFMYSEYSGMPTDKEAAAKVKVETIGPKTVDVPAGKFSGTEMKLVNETGKQLAVYVNAEAIKPFGIVISETDGSIMKLKAHGKDAKTRIKGKIGAMKTPPGMPKNMPRGMPPGMKQPDGAAKVDNPAAAQKPGPAPAAPAK